MIGQAMTLDDLSHDQLVNLWVHGRLVTLGMARKIKEPITISQLGWNLYVQLRSRGYEPTRDEIRRALVDVALAPVDDGLVELVQKA
jgi:hypothetical protein